VTSRSERCRRGFVVAVQSYLTAATRIFIGLDAVDVRCQIDGLAAICRYVSQEDPQSGALFVCRNKGATALKILTYDGDAYWLCHRRLSCGRPFAALVGIAVPAVIVNAPAVLASVRDGPVRLYMMTKPHPGLPATQRVRPSRAQSPSYSFVLCSSLHSRWSDSRVNGGVTIDKALCAIICLKLSLCTT